MCIRDRYTSVGKAGFITAMYIVLVPVLGIFLKKRAGLRVWCGVALAVAGLYLLCMTDGISVNFGDVLLLLCAFAFAIHILIIDYFSPKVEMCIRDRGFCGQPPHTLLCWSNPYNL